MPMRKYRFNGPQDIPRFLLILVALIVFAFAGSAILTVLTVGAFIALVPVFIWERMYKFLGAMKRLVLSRNGA